MKNARAGLTWRIVLSLYPSSISALLYLSHPFLSPVSLPLQPLFFLLTDVCVHENAFAARARHISWLLIHVAADYFPASLWHQIPYSNQNGESASSRAQWSTRASDSHWILHVSHTLDLTQIALPPASLLEKYFSVFFVNHGCAFTLAKLWQNTQILSTISIWRKFHEAKSRSVFLTFVNRKVCRWNGFQNICNKICT